MLIFTKKISILVISIVKADYLERLRKVFPYLGFTRKEYLIVIDP